MMLNRLKEHIKITVFVSVIIGMIIPVIIINLAPIIAQWDITTVMAAITIAMTLCNGVIPAIATIFVYRKEREDALEDRSKEVLCMKSDISVNIADYGMVTFSAWIENIGNTRFDTYITNLYIDKGKELVIDEGEIVFYDFPELLKHKAQGKEYDCVLKLKCMADDITYPSKTDISQTYDNEYEDFGYPRELKHLSRESVQFLLPGEHFSEDIVIKLKSGVYRVIMVVTTTTEGCECSCSSKQFYVPEYEEKELEGVSNGRYANCPDC